MRMPLARRSLVALKFAGLVVSSLIIAGCTGSDKSSSASGQPETGGTVVVSTPADASSLMPALLSNNTDREVSDLLFDRLAEIGDDMNTVGDKGFTPRLADRWEWAPDSLSIAFHLNPKAKWHDGQPVRANDVRFSVQLIKDPAFASPAAPLVLNIDSVSVRDSLTPVAWFKHRTPEQFYDLVYQVAIVPAHVLSGIPAAQLAASDMGRKGIGSGQFRLAKWEPGTRMELVADTGNYRGRPKLDRIVFSISPDFNAAVTRFMSGDADVFENLRPEQLKALATDTARRTVKMPALGYYYLAFNMIDPKMPGRAHPVFSDAAVRRALSMAADRVAMLKNVFDTGGVLGLGPFPRALAVADTTLPIPAYDTTRARLLLDSAGWRMQPDGFRAKGATRLAVSIVTPSSSAARHAYSILLQDAFRKVGADVKIDESDFASYTAKLNAHKFDAEMANFNTDPSVSGLKQSWTASAVGKDGNNYYSYINKKVDALLDSATNAFDPAKTRAFARRAFVLIVNDAPAIWLYEPASVAGVQRRIHITKTRADAPFADMANWWIPAGERNARDKIGLRPAQ